MEACFSREVSERFAAAAAADYDGGIDGVDYRETVVEDVGKKWREMNPLQDNC